MKMTLTRYGRPQLVFFLVLLICLGVLFWAFFRGAWPWAQVGLAVLYILMAAFFRDPHREVPMAGDVLVAPADGKITDIIEMDEVSFFHGRVKRIGIFLSVFDVHLNRAPCAGETVFIEERPGKCLNALRHGAASAENQATSLGLKCPESKAGQVMVRQITGAIARRIVCDCVIGKRLARGERYGMIKFGSRTELFWPSASGGEVLVRVGDTVRAGETILVQFE